MKEWVEGEYHDSEAVGGTVAQWGKGEKTARGCN